MSINPSFWQLLRHLPKLIRLVFRLLKDRRVPMVGKLILALALAYLLWPMDLLPDFLLPVIGSFDDLAILLASVKYLLYRTPPAVLNEHLMELSAG